jgi:hypothetical protein
MKTKSQNTPVVHPGMEFPLDRWFQCTIESTRGLPETFHYNPTSDEARIDRAGHTITASFFIRAMEGGKEDVYVVINFPKNANNGLLFTQEAFCYRPSSEDMINIMSKELLSDLTESIQKYSTVGNFINQVSRASHQIYILLDWSYSLKKSEFEEVLNKIEKPFFDQLVVFVADGYYKYNNDSTGGDMEIMISSLKNVLKYCGYTGIVTKLNKALKEARTK